jgi:hypothetical protein
MGTRVYIETSVVSYYTARPNRDVVIAGHQQATQEFWTRLGSDFEPYVSALVIDEASEGDAEQVEKRLQAIRSFHAIQTTPEAEALARQIIAGRGIPAEYPEDALHIALAAIGGVNFLVTWKFHPHQQPLHAHDDPADRGERRLRVSGNCIAR